MAHSLRHLSLSQLFDDVAQLMSLEPTDATLASHLLEDAQDELAREYDLEAPISPQEYERLAQRMYRTLQAALDHREEEAHARYDCALSDRCTTMRSVIIAWRTIYA